MPLVVTLNVVNFAAHCQWSLVYQESNPEVWFDDIEVAQDGTVYALSVGKIYRSTDFGETWSIDSTWGNGATKIQFVNADTGYVCCGLADYEEDHLMTIDGGLTWMPCGIDLYFSILDIEYLPGELSRAATGGASSWITGGKYCLSYVWQDTIAVMGEVYDLDIVNDSVFFMCGEIMPADPFAFSTVVKSVDTGYHWQVSGEGYEVPYFGMDWPTDSVGYGNGLEHMYKTIDQGETWFKLPNPFGDTLYNYYFHTPLFCNLDTGYVSAYRYQPGATEPHEIIGVIKTYDGGMNWLLTDMPDDAHTGVGIDCWNSDTCFFYFSDRIYRTTNGGGIGVPLFVNYFGTLNLTLHPNPASTTCNLEGLSAYPGADVTTVSLGGRFVPLAFENGQADVSHLPPGMYLTTVQTQQGIWREKWVKY